MSLLMQTVEWIRSVALSRLRGSPALRNLDTAPGTPVERLVYTVAAEARKQVVNLVSFGNKSIIPTEATGDMLRRQCRAYGVEPIERRRP